MKSASIESALKVIDQASFQRLMNQVLEYESYEFSHAPGDVLGKVKTSKGSPDAVFMDGGKYVLCEYTTQDSITNKGRFFTKLKEDITHCFDTQKTKIPKDEVFKIILGFTGKINTEEQKQLRNHCSKYNTKTKLVFFSAQKIAKTLVKYPGLIDDFIPGIKTTDGALITLSKFLQISERGIQPSLTNEFLGREHELNEAEKLLKEKDILLLHGGQGVGKTKIGVELAQRLRKKRKRAVLVIVSNPNPVWDDLQRYILSNKPCIILYDDANKSLGNLSQVIQFIKTQNAGHVKVILTVRDYLRDEVEKSLSDIEYTKKAIDPMESDTVRSLIQQFAPKGKHFTNEAVERIVTLSKLNSRLAVMAAQLLAENTSLHQFEKVIDLYNKYFEGISNDAGLLKKPLKLKALGVVSFFGSLQKNDNYLPQVLKDNFDIEWSSLWETLQELHENELVDIIYGEVVKISDQVLSTYAFYKTFIDKESALIPFHQWIETFVDSHNKQLEKSLIDVNNSLGYELVKESIQSDLITCQNKLYTESLFSFYRVFWLYCELDTLQYLKKWISELSSQYSDNSEINNFLPASPNYLDLLSKFWRHNTTYLPIAIELGLDLLLKDESAQSSVISTLKEQFEYKFQDIIGGCHRQQLLVEKINERIIHAEESDSRLLNQLLVKVAPDLLRWQNSDYRSNETHTITIQQFKLRCSESMLAFRGILLTWLFGQGNNALLQIEKVISQFSETDKQVLFHEQEMLYQLFAKHLSPEKYAHCELADNYVRILQRKEINPLKEWCAFLQSPSMKVKELLSFDRPREQKDFNKREEQRKANIRSLIKDADEQSLHDFLQSLERILSEETPIQKTYWIESGLNTFFEILAESNTTLYFEALTFVRDSSILQPKSGNLIYTPLKNGNVQSKQVYETIDIGNFPLQVHWKATFFRAIDEVNDYYTEQFILFVGSQDIHIGLYNLGDFMKFNKPFESGADKTLISTLIEGYVNVVEFIVEKTLLKSESTFPYTEPDVCAANLEFLNHRIDLLKSLYSLMKKTDSHYDFNGSEMATICQIDPQFIIEYLIEVTKDTKFLEFRFADLDLSFVWELSECESIMDQAMQIIIDKAPIFSDIEHQANVLFKYKTFTDERRAKALKYIKGFIHRHSNSKQHIHIILNVVVYSFNDQVIPMFKEFLSLNKDPSFVRNLYLEKNEVIQGSRIPVIDFHIKFTKDIIKMISSLPNLLDYTEHIK